MPSPVLPESAAADTTPPAATTEAETPAAATTATAEGAVEGAVDQDMATVLDSAPGPLETGPLETARTHESAPLSDTATTSVPAEASAPATTSDSTDVPAAADVDVSPSAVVADGQGGGPAEEDSAGPETATAEQEQSAAGEAPGNDAARRGRSSRWERTSRHDYWDGDDTRLAGQVYPVEDTDTEVVMPAHKPQTLTGDGDGDTNGSVHQPQPRELDEDAPPFATAPFATIPRLNRVRATPTPPADANEDDDEDG